MDKEKKDLLVFGYGLGEIAVIFAVGGIHKHGFGLPQKTLLLCAVTFVLVTVLKWEALRPGYKGWMKVAHIIGGVVATGILGIVFFVLFAPVGLFLRLIGKDHLDMKTDPLKQTYWQKRAGHFKKDEYTHQF